MWVLLLAVIALLVFAVPPLWQDWSGGYTKWKCERALRKANDAFQAKDMASAALALQVAVRADRTNPKVWQTIADMTEAMGAREAIQQRIQVATLQPGNVQAQLALAITAMRFGDIYTARDALKAVPPDLRDGMDYRRAVALFAMVEGNGGTAENVLASVIKDDSSDGVRLAYATVRMSHPNPAMAATARQELAGMAENTATAAPALRELFGDAIFRKDFAAARTWAERLVKLPTAQYRDHLALANLFLLVDHRPLEEVLGPLLEKAKANPSDMADLVRWLLAQGQAIRARAIVDSLPTDVKDSFIMKAARLDLATAQGDWPAVGELLRQGALGPVPDVALRMAMEARNVGEIEGEAARLKRWQLAIEQTRTNIFGMRMLYRLAFAWRWVPEGEATLMAIAENFPGQTWAHEALVKGYTSQQNGPGLLKIFALWHQQESGVNRLTHDWALMDMLVNPVDVWNQSKAAAEQLYLNESTNPNFSTACALAYTQAGRNADALSIIDKLKPEERRDSARAPYLAYIYAQGGRAKEAREQLALPHPARALKEEVQMAQLAKKRAEQIEQQEAEIRRLTGAAEPVPANGADK
jgi:thioredoxin-like negative regulator of GroEL